MANGYMGKILRVDLTTGSIGSYEPEKSEREAFVGGSGLGAKILSHETGAHTDPLGPDNVLVFMTGPATGTAVPASGRHSVCAKSPLTGAWGEASCGGSWGTRLKRTGHDGIIVKGKAKKPVYLLITEDETKLIDASNLWGKGNHETQEILEKEYGARMTAASIGQAGENQVRLAGIFTDGLHARAAGRCGLGAVMGSKNLKAIACVGNKKIPVFDEAKLKQLNKENLGRMRNALKVMTDHGTGCGLTNIEARGDLPVKNWYEGSFEEGAKKIDGVALTKQFLTGNYHCRGCPIGCGRVVKLDNGPYASLETGGPEYETLAAFGSICLADDLRTICIANQLCNDYGLDTISTGAVIAFGMEAQEKGLLSGYDMQGADLSWGNQEGILKAIELIAQRKGVGDLLAEGVKRAAQTLGGLAEEFAIHVKGMEFPMHDPRCFNSIAVGYPTSNRGACHLQGYTHAFELGVTLPEYGYPESPDRWDVEGKGKMVGILQNIMAMMDSLCMCKFMIEADITLSTVIEWLNAVTGWTMDPERFNETGERLFNQKRLYNVRNGISRKDDNLPPRMLTHARKTGGAAGHLPPYGEMLAEYYESRGWNEMGIPTQETVARLGLKD